jgi:hypothetical protein
MKNEELRKIIAECVQEVIQEQEIDEVWGSELWSGIKKTFAPESPDSEKSKYDRSFKTSEKNVKYNTTGSGMQSKMRADAREKIQKIKTNFEANLKKTMRDAFHYGDSVGFKRSDTKKIFMTSIMSIMNQYKRLEEESPSSNEQ